MADPVHYVKFRHRDDKRFSFLTPGGGSTYLCVHAARFATREKAQAFIDANAADNTEFQWKVAR